MIDSHVQQSDVFVVADGFVGGDVVDDDVVDWTLNGCSGSSQQSFHSRCYHNSFGAARKRVKLCRRCALKPDC